MAVRDKQNKTGLGIRERTIHKYFCEGDRENNTRGGLDMTMQRLPGQRTVLGPFLTLRQLSWCANLCQTKGV